MTDAITTTLAAIRAKEPCKDGWTKLISSLGGIKEYGENTPLTFRQIYKSNGHSDMLWCLRALPAEYAPLIRHFAVDCAEQVNHLMTDPRSLNALVVARRHADGLATDEELKAAYAAAYAAAHSAAHAYSAAAQAQLLFEYCRTGKRVQNPERFFEGVTK